MVVALRTDRTVWVRPAVETDLRQVEDVIAADCLGIAPTSARRTGPLTSGLTRQALLVAHDGHGQVLGAAALCRAGARDLLTGGVAWLHCREHPVTAAVLVRAALERSAGLSAVTAFTEPTPWPPHLPGLALHDRPVTFDAFTDAGFRTADQWLLFQRPPQSGQAGNADRAERCTAPPVWVTAAGGISRTPHSEPFPLPDTLWRGNLRRSLERVDAGGYGRALTTVDLLAPRATRRCEILRACGFEEVDLLRSLVLV
ncbi:hypothetical protein ACFC1T_25685 [Kitasatospora sp. NPDC056076]|uniref:hypothetical protein n=1 Tax=Kitasatospora sp. NPDC056076 TaxID=3345703 RepID=UPI0035D93C9F